MSDVFLLSSLRIVKSVYPMRAVSSLAKVILSILRRRAHARERDGPVSPNLVMRRRQILRGRLLLQYYYRAPPKQVFRRICFRTNVSDKTGYTREERMKYYSTPRLYQFFYYFPSPLRCTPWSFLAFCPQGTRWDLQG